MQPRSQTVALPQRDKGSIVTTYNWRIEDGQDDDLSYFLVDSKSQGHWLSSGDSPQPSQRNSGSSDEFKEAYELENPANYLPHYKDYFYHQGNFSILESLSAHSLTHSHTSAYKFIGLGS